MAGSRRKASAPYAAFFGQLREGRPRGV